MSISAHHGMALIAALLTAVIPAGVAQTNAAAAHEPAGKKFAYDTVSIRQEKPGFMGQLGLKTTPDGLSGRAILWGLVYLAYPGTHDLVGLPAWAKYPPPFAVEMKMDEDTAAALAKLSPKEQSEQRMLMLRAVLEDRFKLKVHHEYPVQSVYDLVIAKSGARLTEAKPDEGEGALAMRSGMIIVSGRTIDGLAEVLAHVPEVGHNVQDRTGLTGRYDIRIRYEPDQSGTATDAGDESQPTIFTALEEQVGLKLVPAREPVDTIVVDHVELPSAN